MEDGNERTPGQGQPEQRLSDRCGGGTFGGHTDTFGQERWVGQEQRKGSLVGFSLVGPREAWGLQLPLRCTLNHRP